MADQKVKVRIQAKDEASASVAQVEGRFTRLGNFLKSRFVITLGDVTRLMRGVVGVFGDVVSAAQKQEDAVRKLDASLEKLGPSSANVSKALQEQASALQNVTRYGDEAVIEAQAFLATLGVQAEQLPQATRATVDLAAALGISLEAAARNVGKTVGGFAGELGEVIPELKNLSVEALRSGEGIALLAEKFSGRAAADAKTFSGLMDQLGNAFGDLKENAGQALTENAGFRDSLSSLVTLMKSEAVADTISGIAEATAKLALAMAEGAKETVSATKKMATWFHELDASANAWLASLFGLNAAHAEQAKVATEAAEAVESLAGATDKHAQAVERANRIEREYKDALGEVRDIARELGVALESEVNAQLEKNAQQLEKVEAAARRGVITWEDSARISRAMSESNTDLSESLTDVETGTEHLTEKIEALTGATTRATDAQRVLQTQAEATANSLQSAAGPLFPGLSGKTYTYQTFTPATLADLTYQGGGTFYRGRKVKVLPDGRIEWA